MKSPFVSANAALKVEHKTALEAWERARRPETARHEKVKMMEIIKKIM